MAMILEERPSCSSLKSNGKPCRGRPMHYVDVCNGHANPETYMRRFAEAVSALDWDTCTHAITRVTEHQGWPGWWDKYTYLLRKEEA
jgi:hypothetical protein